MGRSLTAVVVGAGWAGEGHTKALQWCGVEVAAVCARQPEVVRKVANALSVPEASTDWRKTIERVRPDIVAIATPAGLRGPVVETAVAVGAHVLCDKPLATTGEEAGRLYRLVATAGVKHAYAATGRYGPSTRWLAELLREGTIGRVEEIVYTARLGLTGLRPWSWLSSLEQGGGLLNNSFAHLLGIFAEITGGTITRVAGTARGEGDRAPVAPGIHDFRQWIGTVLTPEEAAGMEWRTIDAETAFDALAVLTAPHGPVTIVVAHAFSGVPVAAEPTGMRLYGDTGTLIADGWLDYDVSHVRASGAAPEPLPVPQRLLDELPRVGSDELNKWCALARDYVADIRGEPHQPYLTFRDGWRYQLAIDAIRTGGGWTPLPM